MITEKERIIYNMLLYGNKIPQDQLELISIEALESFRKDLEIFFDDIKTGKIKLPRKTK